MLSLMIYWKGEKFWLWKRRERPKRFKHVAPLPPEVPLAAWINPPKRKVPSPAQPSTVTH